MSQPPSERNLIAALHAQRRTFGPKAAREKLRLLDCCAECVFRVPSRLRAYHDTLLFMAAFPDDAAVLERVDGELRRLAARAAELVERRGPDTLLDSGIAGTEVESAYSLDLLDWLVTRVPGDVEIAWDDESSDRGVHELLPACVARVEADGLIGTGLFTREWLQLARGGHRDRESDLAWLVKHLRGLDCPRLVLDQLFDAQDIPVRVRLRDPVASTTFMRFPPRPLVPLKRAPARQTRLRAELARPLPRPARLGERERRALLDVARTSLVVRKRETDPATYGDPRDVTLFRLEDGIDVALFGMRPDRRLPIETFVGYLAARNRLPVAYGGGWIFLDRTEIGINVFDAFRGAGAGPLFARIMRVYYQHFRARRFTVDPYQFGADNRDGIQSGAFWFYYRFGFRPVTREARSLAAEEWRRLRADRTYRSPVSVLRRFTLDKLALDVDPPTGPAPDLMQLGLGVTRAIGARFGGDRIAAQNWAQRRVRRELGVRPASWPDEERAAFDRLCPLVALMDDLDAWPVRDRRSLVAVMRAKGGPRERDYALALQCHRRLREALVHIASAE